MGSEANNMRFEKEVPKGNTSHHIYSSFIIRFVQTGSEGPCSLGLGMSWLLKAKVTGYLPSDMCHQCDVVPEVLDPRLYPLVVGAPTCLDGLVMVFKT